MSISKIFGPALCALLIAGCGDDDLKEAGYSPPLEYSFSSRTNSEFPSSVSNEQAVTQKFLISEIFYFLDSSTVNILAPTTVTERLDKIYSAGTVRSSTDIDTSLTNFNIYTGFTGEGTPISEESTATEPFLQQSFSDLAQEINILDSIADSDRALPFNKIIEIAGIELTVANFIGLSELTAIIDGNDMPKAIVSDWLERRALLKDEGIYVDRIIPAFLRGAINYSIISQLNLNSAKGLLEQNSDPVNLSTVLEQEQKVNLVEAQLERATAALEASENYLEEKLQEWIDLDANADPSKPMSDYLTDYSFTTIAQEYYEQKNSVENAEEYKATVEESLITKRLEVEALLPYTKLGKTWDEALGYFGASRFYGLQTDSEITDQPSQDYDSDLVIDVFTEMNFGYAVFAAERDNSAALKNTDFSGDIWNAFLLGREIIQQNFGRDSVEFVGYHNELKAQADIIIKNLEKVIAATIINQINKTILSLDSDTAVSSVDNQYFKDWSTLKGMALTLQFNNSPVITADQLVNLHSLIKDVPINDGSYRLAHITDLTSARNIIRDTYGFAEANALVW